MITFSNLFEAAQPVPPQQPVQQTGAQVPQPQQKPVQQGQYPQQYQQYPNQMQQPQPQEQKPDGILGAIKSGYDAINQKYETGKEIAKGLAPVAMNMALPVGMLTMKANPAIGGALYTAGMMGMYGSRLLSAPAQAKMAVDRAKAQQNYR